MRIDLVLVKKKLAASRTQAAELISIGAVYLVQDGKRIQIKKNSFELLEDAQIIVEMNTLQKYVSRAGLKLEFALEIINLDIRNLNVLDVGQSTGGFSDCLLKRGANSVIGIEVGHSQLHATLLGHPKIKTFENLNIKDAESNNDFLQARPKDGFDLIVADVSFISLTKVIRHLVLFLKEAGHFLFLVKPQFECGPQHLDKNGIVKDDFVYAEIEKTIRLACTESFGLVLNYFDSEPRGKDGNKEYFIYGRKKSN